MNSAAPRRACSSSAGAAVSMVASQPRQDTDSSSRGARPASSRVSALHSAKDWWSSGRSSSHSPG
nr:hypothetical protein [Azospirillum brasilense]